MVAKAEKRSEAMIVLPNSFTEGAGNVAGLTGQIAFAQRRRGIDAVDADTYKKASVVPQPHYDNTVNGATARQRADFYVFLHVICLHRVALAARQGRRQPG